MYAVIKSGGKQHRVVEGELLKVELLDVEPGQTITLEDVLMVVNGDDIKIGTRVEMTFRRLFTADGISNYFWKARPVRGNA